MGRNCYGPKLTWADFVMGRNDPEPEIASSAEFHSPNQGGKMQNRGRNLN